MKLEVKQSDYEDEEDRQRFSLDLKRLRYQ